MGGTVSMSACALGQCSEPVCLLPAPTPCGHGDVVSHQGVVAHLHVDGDSDAEHQVCSPLQEALHETSAAPSVLAGRRTGGQASRL